MTFPSMTFPSVTFPTMTLPANTTHTQTSSATTLLDRWAMWTGAALFALPVLIFAAMPATAETSQSPSAAAAGAPAIVLARTERAAPRHDAKKPAEPPPQQAGPKRPPARIPFTAEEDAAAIVPGMPDARFWADSDTDFKNALPEQPGPWLILSSGGADGAFGAGLLNGLSAAGKRPDYAVVTGVSTGAMMAPFAFAGQQYDDALRDAYTKITAADVFEAGGTGESFVNSWPLKDLIAKQITPALLADIAAAYRRGRRLFVVTSDLDTERSRGLEHGRHRRPWRRATRSKLFRTRAAGVRLPFPAGFRRC